MKNSKNFSVRKIALGASSTLLATLIAANGTGVVHASENHNSNQSTSQKNMGHEIKNTQNKATNNNNIFANEELRKTTLALVSAAEHTSYKYDEQFNAPPENIEDERGLTAGLIGFTTNGDDMKHFIDEYNKINPNNHMKDYTKAIYNVSGTEKTDGLEGADKAWKDAAKNDRDNMIKAQKRVIAHDYMEVAEKYAEKDGLKSKLSRYIYFDAIVKHGPGRDKDAATKDWSFGDLRAHARSNAKTPAEGGDEKAYLKDFVGQRYNSILAENNYLKKHNHSFDSKHTTDRLDTQMKLLDDNNFDLKLPINYKINTNNYRSLTQEKLDALSSSDANFDGIWD
ncbi:chitosanase [Staphylococcus epidermidis]|uniref:chitosanase n=1 Tax=Staphylococcus epidermidis TaxID=1282 RepID=UPI0011AA75E5|nr:chitosanase [Staphylococcus epidermidis]MBC3170003.1 chitosanase [Staphylococcus epidermidis]MBE7319841.1 chitosanase [Staphylococcus epidermidis]MBM0809385.1 chitosanase [Staphylococcus epidermidis]MBM0824155.1 chitosanase [Staphylococcus epidermidis]MBM0852931.1 chitosanase [Staphylococcus epidermidis]